MKVLSINPKKQEVLNEITFQLKDKSCFIFANYSKLSALDFTAFRKNLKAKNAIVKIYKNNLLKLALKNIFENNSKLIENINPKLVGPLVYIFAKQNEMIDISKLLVLLDKKKVVSLKGGLLENSYYSKDQINELSTIPPREVLLVKLLNQFQLPLIKFLNVLNGNIKKLFFALNQIKDKKQKDEKKE